jgi:hypothetical protein
MNVVGEFEAMLRKTKPSGASFMDEVDPVGVDPVKRWFKENGFNIADLKG